MEEVLVLVRVQLVRQLQDVRFLFQDRPQIRFRLFVARIDPIRLQSPRFVQQLLEPTHNTHAERKPFIGHLPWSRVLRLCAIPADFGGRRNGYDGLGAAVLYLRIRRFGKMTYPTVFVGLLLFAEQRKPFS